MTSRLTVLCASLSTVALLQSFADADDRNQCVLASRLNFFGDLLISFAAILPPFGVTDDDMTTAKLFQHRTSDFAGKCSLRFPMEVLRGQVDRSSG